MKKLLIMLSLISINCFAADDFPIGLCSISSMLPKYQNYLEPNIFKIPNTNSLIYHSSADSKSIMYQEITSEPDTAIMSVDLEQLSNSNDICLAGTISGGSEYTGDMFVVKNCKGTITKPELKLMYFTADYEILNLSGSIEKSGKMNFNCILSK